jgi:predicted DNA-binding transcriptional regulator AlpA
MEIRTPERLALMAGSIVRPEEVSGLTTVPLETLKYWRKLGRGPRWYKLGGRVVYDLDEVERWIAEQRELTGVGGQDGALSV